MLFFRVKIRNVRHIKIAVRKLSYVKQLVNIRLSYRKWLILLYLLSIVIETVTETSIDFGFGQTFSFMVHKRKT